MALLVISYSRVDQPLVRPLVRLLRAANPNVRKAVYWDDDFEAGESWFARIREYINRSPQLFVFWCEHSASSDQVKREYDYAIQRGKRVVPVLIDNAPLPAELGPIHEIDLRGVLIQKAAKW